MTRRILSARCAVLIVPVAALMALATPATAAPAEEDPADRGPLYASYVALGDSYAAGPLIPLQTGLPAGCLRSNRNYPSLVAATGRVPDFRDVSCSGATVDELFVPQATGVGVNPAQLDALGPDTEAVSLTIGGNDIGFGEIVQECARRSPLEPLGSACKDFYTAGGTDTLAARIADTADEIDSALEEIGNRSPGAEVVVVGYPAILPEDSGCFPVVPFSPDDVAYLRDTEKALNAMLEDRAEAAGAEFADTYTPTIGHDACTPPGTRWVEGLVPTALAAPVHPNALGMLAMAQAALGEMSDDVLLVASASPLGLDD